MRRVFFKSQISISADSLPSLISGSLIMWRPPAPAAPLTSRACSCGLVISRSAIACLADCSGIWSLEIGGGGLDSDNAPLKQLGTRGTLGHGQTIGHADPESESLSCAV